MGPLNQFIEHAEGLYALLGQTAKPCVAVIGSFNSGKSTLINGLLGMELSPVGVIPTTNCLISFDYSHNFSAVFTGSGQYWPFQHTDELRSFLGSLKTTGRIAVTCPSPVLQKCRLVDTPGIDGPLSSINFVEQAVTEADYVIYFFHQRGIEDFNRLFLYRLADIWKNKDLNKLSFWLNCNHGLCDGTSLEKTREVLREIFLSQVRCNTINTHNHNSLEAIKLYLEIELARDTCRQASRFIKRLDNELPGRLGKVARIKEETAFLTEFWSIKETSRVILETGQLLQSLPTVSGALEHTLRNANLANPATQQIKAGGLSYRPRPTGLSEIRDGLLALAGDLLSEKTIEITLDRPAIEKIIRAIRTRRFTAAALGGFSTGKTTFFNALLKEELLPAADGPTTTAVTRITYGRNKKATIHFPLQITLRICEQVGDKIGIYREQLQALDKWLAPGNEQIAAVEYATGGSFQHIDRQELQKRIHQMAELFAAGKFARIPASNSRLPAVFRLISKKAAKKNFFLEQVRVTFKNSWSSEFDLSDQNGREQFKNTLGAGHAFRFDQVVLEHPSEFLRHTDFLDTPGLDWIQKHHYEKSADLIRQSDAYLVFLNGKHILNQMDRQNIRTLLLDERETGFQMQSTHEQGRYFFVINFADVLNLAEQETVCNLLRKNTGISNGNHTPHPGGPQVFPISARRALYGDTGAVNALLKAVEESIIKYRAGEFYLGQIAELFRSLDEAALRASEACLARDGSGKGRLMLRKARETLRLYRRRLKELRNSISPSKPP